MVYPLLLFGIIAAFLFVFFSSKTFDAVVLRETGNPHTMTDDGLVRNILKLKLTNRTDEEMKFSVAVEAPEDAEIEFREVELVVGPRETKTFHASVVTAPDSFILGRADLKFQIHNQNDVSRTLSYRLIGPYR